MLIKLIKSNRLYIKFNSKKKTKFYSLFNKYLIKKRYRKIKPFFKQLFILILHISGVIFYILSLTPIEGLEMKCFSFSGIQCYYILAKLTCISGIITCFILYIILYKKYNKMYFFIIMINYLFLYLIDHHKEIVKHGYYNFIGFLATTVFFFWLLNFIHFLIFLFKKKAYIFFLIFINIPKSHSCYLPEIGPFFDFTSKYRPTCLDKKIK